MNNSGSKTGWNLNAQSFEPKLLNELQPEANIKQGTSDHRSTSASLTPTSNVSSECFTSLYLNNAQSHELIAQFNNMAMSPQFDQPHLFYMPSNNGALLANHSLSNGHHSLSKSAVSGINPYLNTFVPYNKINQPMPYMLPATVSSTSTAADRSRRNSCMSHKVFNTGEPNVDKHLTETYKMINPRSNFNRDTTHSRFFIIKSYTEDHVHRSIKYGEWCSTQRGNDILDKAFRSVQSQIGHIYLFFSVNSSGYFCGVAEMKTECDPGRRSSHWNDDKWQGGFLVDWLYVKDVPNKYLKHIILEYNDNRPITNSRDTTEIKPAQKGYETLRLIHEYHHNSSLFDDFEFYESLEREALHNIQSSNIN